MADTLHTLTSFRFFAAFWVFLFHLRLRIDHGDGWFWEFIGNGARGVDFFFILSGFVIFHVYGPQIAAGRFSRRRYFIRRLARIYPLHLAMLLAFLALALAGGNQTEGVLASALLLHAWGLTDGLVLNGPSWTISAEMFAYLLFGLIAVRPLSTRVIALATAVAAVAAHLFARAHGTTGFIHLTWDFGVLRILPLFLLGMLLRRLAPRLSMAAAAAAGGLGLALLLIFGGRPEAGYEILLPFSLLILAGARLSEWPALPTNRPLPVYLGEISYSIYMIHMLVIAACIDYLPKLGLPVPPLPVIGLVLIAGSALSYRLIEQPARRRLNRLA